MMILNEEKYARDILLGKNRNIKSAITKIGYITRYNLHILGKDDIENYTSTVLWMNKHQDNFEEAVYSNAISNAINGAKKRKFYKIDNIVVTKNEIEIIKSLNNIREEKILFVLLCLAKQQAVSMNFIDGLVQYTITDLCKMARVSVPADDREYILHDILVKNLISCPKKNDTKCLRVNFIDIDGDAELVLDETDCQELAYVYLKWKDGKGFKHCKSCGRLMRSKGSKDMCTYCEQSPKDTTHIWCIDCGEEVEISEFDSETCRCKKCKEIHDKIIKSEQNKRAYELKKEKYSVGRLKINSTKLMLKNINE